METNRLCMSLVGDLCEALPSQMRPLAQNKDFTNRLIHLNTPTKKMKKTQKEALEWFKKAVKSIGA